jgi:hypothetical protein
MKYVRRSLIPTAIIYIRVVKLLSVLALVAMLASRLALAQSVQNFIIDPVPPAAPLEVTVDYFTSATVPSVVVGSSSFDGGPGGYYLYQSANDLNGPWTRTTIDPEGDAYEITRAYTWPGDEFPGVMASRSGQLVWYYNPKNWGGDPTQPWPMQVINPNAPCHDMLIVDFDQDGLPDVVCSSTFYAGTVDFIAFANAYGDWTIVDDPLRVNGESIGDYVALLSVSGSDRINIVGATPSGIYWFRNPLFVGGNPRTDLWMPFLVGAKRTGQSVGRAVVKNTPYGEATDGIVAASGEEPWPQGLVWYSPGTNPQARWTAHRLDSTYRAVHGMVSGDFYGTPYFIVAEQEQAGGTPTFPAEHPGIPSRVVMFTYAAGVFNPTLEVSTQGSRNQSTVIYNNSLLVVGVNHNLLGTEWPALQAWLISPM